MRYEIKLEKTAVHWSLKALWVMGEGLDLSWSNDKPFSSFEQGDGRAISVRRGVIQGIFWL